MAEPVPVTLLTGFLGSGKTTLVNRLLTERAQVPMAVVVNEFGDVGIDGRLVVGSSEEVVELSNGCLCCAVRGDLVGAIGSLLAARERRIAPRRFERLLIEASGLASPGPIAQTLAVEGSLVERVRLDGVVTLAHAGHLVRQLGAHPEAAEQVGYADLVLLNHTDAATPEEADAAEAEVRRRNPLAEVLRTERAGVDPGRVLDLEHRHDLGALPEGSGIGAGHAHDVTNVVLRASEPLDLHALKMWIQFLASRRTHELIRVKGVLACRDHPEPVVLHGLYQWLEFGPGAGEVPAESTLVLIGRGLDPDEIQRGWEAALRGGLS